MTEMQELHVNNFGFFSEPVTAGEVEYSLLAQPTTTRHDVRSKGTLEQTPGTTLVPLCSMEERIMAIRRQCQKLGLSQTPKRVGFLTDPQHKVAYCEISKVGSTNMKRVLATSTTKGKAMSPNRTRNWHSTKLLRRVGLKYQHYDHMAATANFTRFFIVRHPFDRLISAYNSKLGPLSRGNGGYAAISARIVKVSQRRSDKGQQQLQGNRTKPTVAEFIHALVHRKISLTNNHWVPYAARYCHPCQVDYDHILRLESMTHDSVPVMRRLGVSDDHAAQHRAKSVGVMRVKQGTVSDGNRTFAVFKPLDVLSDVPQADLEKLYAMYRLDFELYGYSFDVRTLQTGCLFNDVGCC